MKAVMISIQPKWCEKIANGDKTIEVRKTKPNIDVPFKCYIYCTKNGRPLVCGSPAPNLEETLVQTYGYSRKEADEVFGALNGKCVGEFICDKIYIRPKNTLYLKNAQRDFLDLLNEACISEQDLLQYCGGNYNKDIYFWHISDLKIYDRPKELSKFRKGCNDSYDPMFGNYCENCNNKCKVNKPPQSWGYVEEIK